jgi:hypothetical protein
MINFEGVSLAKMAEVHNICAEMHGIKPVNKFSDRASAERRTAHVLSLVPGHLRPEPFKLEDQAVVEAKAAAHAAQQALDDAAAKIEAARAEDAKAFGDDDGEKPKASATQDAETAPAPPPAKPAEASDELDFGEREGTNRKLLIDAMVAKRNQFIPLVDLIRAVYPEAPADNAKAVAEFKGRLGMVMKGMVVMINNKNLPVSLDKQKSGKEIKYGLIDKAK